MSALASPKKGKGGSITIHNSELYSELLMSDPEQCEKVETSQVKKKFKCINHDIDSLEPFRESNCVSPSTLWLLTY